MTDPLKDTSPLGKSVEEIEQESGNTTNSSVPTEERRDDHGVGVVPLIPVAATAGVGVTGGAAVGAVLITQEGLDNDRADDGPEDRDVGLYPQDTPGNDRT